MRFNTWLENQQVFAYHITFKHLLPAIQKQGLSPNKPSDFAGETKSVFLFKSVADAENALSNWLGERIDDMEQQAGFQFEELLLTIDITGLNCVDTAGYELSCSQVIPPQRIVKVEPI